MKLFRMAAAVVLAVVVAAFTVVGYLAAFVAMSRYPIQATAVVAAGTAATALWFKGGTARAVRRARRRPLPPEPEKAAPAPDVDDQLRDVLGPQVYEELRSLGARDATGP